MTTLVEKAKKFKRQHKKELSTEELALGMAWATGEVSMTQAMRALGMDPKRCAAQFYCLMARVFRQCVEDGILIDAA